MFLRLAIKSLHNRKSSVLLTLFAITLSIFVMFAVEHIRKQVKTSFSHTVSGVDLIVGSRTSSLNLLLYSIFRIGTPTNNISWSSFERIKADDRVDWVIPISLGDSHKGYRVLGTNNNYFKHFKYGSQQSLRFHEGKSLEQTFDIVLGSGIASALGYKLGDNLTLAHGMVSTHFTKHTDNPFNVVGILHATGTPVDQTLHVSFQGLDALHMNSQTPVTAHSIIHKKKLPRNTEHLHERSHKNAIEHDHKKSPKNITALMVGLKSKMTTFPMQRSINTDDTEPLLAILPGVALLELWQSVSILENSLRLISVLVFISALLGLSAILLSSIKERYREIQLLRTIGATPLFLYSFIKLEAMLITLLSTLCAIGVLYISLLLTKDYLLTQYGLLINTTLLSLINLQWLALVFLCAFIAAVPSSVIAFKGGSQS